MQPIRILLADDHNVLRQGMAQVLDAQPDMQVIAQAGTGRKALTLARRHRPDVVLLDIHMPDLDGLEVTWRLAQEFPEMGILILTMYRQEAFVLNAIKAGARGYLLKEAELDELIAAIRAVARGEAVIDPALAGHILAEIRGEPRAKAPLKLSKRDTEILRLLADGLSNQEIAARLGITEKTVRNRLSLLFRQLHLKNRTEAALFALKKGLLDQNP